MPELVVAVLARDSEQRNILQLLVEGTRVARTVQTFSTLPLASTDPVIRRIHDHHPDVVLMDIPAADTASAIRAIEVLHQELGAIGEMVRARRPSRLPALVSLNTLAESFVHLIFQKNLKQSYVS
jgi:CheY-like chemotaxis protein